MFTYTMIELKEARSGYVDFRRKKDAEAFYFQLLRGADFYLGDPQQAHFVNPRQKLDPW